MANWADMIEADPQVMGGKPVITGTRLTVEFIIERLADGWSEDVLKCRPTERPILWPVRDDQA